MSEIDDKYAALPNAHAILGDPMGPEGDAMDGGRYRHYQFGSIYFHPSTGAHEVHGAIHGKWASLAYETGVLGYPETDETTTPDGIGRFNHFQHGSIYWTPDTGAHEVHGPIHDTWSATGWEQGPGYPVTDIVTLTEFAQVEVCWFTNETIASPAIFPSDTFIVSRSVGALLVVVPNTDFLRAAEPFLHHKRTTGVPTFVHVMPAASPTQEDAPFQLKGRIMEAALWLNVKWVLLLGDASLIPTRHRCTTQIPAGHLGDAWYTPTDFYYADLYPGGIPIAVARGSTPEWLAPDSWDANGNHRYDEQHWANDVASQNPDRVQAIPWIAVGRVPAHTPDQASAYLSKVIAYETNEPTGSVPLSVLTDYHYYSDNNSAYLAQVLLRAANYSTQYGDQIGLDWPEGAPLPADTNMRRGAQWATRMASASSQIVVYIGHGSPGAWAVHSDSFGWCDNANVQTFQNSSNWPIVMAAGCATGSIMVGAAEEGRYLGIDGQAHDYQMTGSTVVDSALTPRPAPVPIPIDPVRPSPFDFPESSSPGFGTGWLLTPNAGGIIYIGEAAVSPDTPSVEFLGRVLRHFSRGRVLGDCWCQGQMDYRTDFLQSEDTIAAPRIYLTYMHLFGDPSLRLW